MKIFGYEIKISKAKKKTVIRPGGYRSRRWTEEEEIMLTDMNDRKLMHKTMASRLDRTVAAIHGRLHTIKERENAKAKS